MAMMTTMEKILAKAEALEAQAAALRLAVTILNGDLTSTKRSALASTINQAMRIRHAQKNGASPEAEAATPRTSRGFKYPQGTHWMQRPENRARVIAMAKARAKQAGQPTRRKRKHWMQRPENRGRVLARIRHMQKAARGKKKAQAEP